MSLGEENEFRLKKYMNKNRDKVYEEARNNTHYNENGEPTISRDDDDFDEDIWDEDYNRLKNMNK